MKRNVLSKIRRLSLKEIECRKREYNINKNKELSKGQKSIRKLRLLEDGGSELKRINNLNFCEVIGSYLKESKLQKVQGEKQETYEIVKNLILEKNLFMKCIFKNIHFVNCSFYGSIFRKCYFENVIFDGCNFALDPLENREKEVHIFYTQFHEKSNFSNCIFNNCNMGAMILENLLILDCEFINCSLKYSLINEALISKIKFSDCDFRAVRIISTSIKEMEFDDKGKSKFDEDTFLDELPVTKESDYEDIYRIYKVIASKFEENNIYSRYGEYYYLYKINEYRTLKGIERFNSSIYWAISGYGERPTYALVTSILIMCIFAIIYMFTGLKVDGAGIVQYNISYISKITFIGIIKDFSRAFHFSIVTFTTVGYGNITPIDLSVLMCSVEMFLGVTMVGIWTATLARKISR